MDDGGATAVGAWESLPLDLLLEIFRRLGSTAIICCAATCKPWRHAIIGNATILYPRQDRFVPNLLLGVFQGYGDYNHQHLYLRRTQGPFQQSALPSIGAAGSESRIQTLIPATAGGFDRNMYTNLMASRDGFILLKGRQWWSGVCLLCNPMTGYCKIIPDATFKSCTYVLLTSYDDVCTGNAYRDPRAVRILAVAGTDEMCTEDNRITYQVFSYTSGDGHEAGAWGPVKRSTRLKMAFWLPVYDPCAVVSNNAVYWLGGPKNRGDGITCAIALDVGTGQAWTTELPEGTEFDGPYIHTPTLLATSGNGRLSLIRSPYPPITTGSDYTAQVIQVWVLMDNGQWSLEKTIDLQQVQELLPSCPHVFLRYRPIMLEAFCPRSGCVIGRFVDQKIRIDLEGSSHTCVERIGTDEGYYCDRFRAWISTSESFFFNNTYEMDWSTYISMMKQF